MTDKQEEKKSYPNLIPLSKWNEHHNYPPISTLRNLVFTMPEGFDRVVFRVNRRVLINESAWFDWIEKQNKKEKKND
jgi:hypothetical protein